MDYTEKILDFIDGTLEPAEARTLFAEMSGDENLQNEFRSQIIIDKTVSKNLTSFVPEEKTTAGVFAALGYSQFSNGTRPADVIKHTKPNNIFHNFLWGGFSSIMTALVFLLFFIPNNEIKTNVQSASPGNVKLNQIVNKDNTKERQDVQHLKDVGHLPERKDVGHLQKFNDNLPVENNPVQPEIYLSKVSMNHASGFSLKNTARQEIYTQNIENLSEINFPKVGKLSESAVEQSSGWELEWRVSENWMLPSETISPRREAPFNKNSLSILYPLSDKFKLGAEIRVENFFQKYKGTEFDGNYTYEQKPNLTTYGAFIRYTAVNMLPYSIKPIAQTYIGFNKAGFVGRLMLGIDYSPYPDFSLIVGGEFGSLIYIHQNNYFNTNKFSMNYGISYKF